MAKYVYPAVFRKEPEFGYSVSFPDISGCFTSGDDLAESIENASDALALMLYDMEESKAAIPAASDIASIKCEDREFASYVTCDTKVYRRRRNTRAIKKTLSIPAWMNDEGIAAGLNFSQILQEGLLAKLGN